MFNVIKALKQFRAAPHRTTPIPHPRRMISDMLHEGRRKNIFHQVFEADVTEFMASKSQARERGDMTCSVTAFLASCLARAIAEQPEMQGYRSAFGKKLVIFKDVDVTLPIERTEQGQPFLWYRTIRACNKKSVAVIDSILKKSKNERIEDTQRGRFMNWFLKLPFFVRRLFWIALRYNPFLMKTALGTVAVTSMGMFSSGLVTTIPITPMTLTMSIGSIRPKVVLQDGEFVQRDIITLCLSVDHDVVDGAPLTRFVETLRTKIANPAPRLAYLSKISSGAGRDTSKTG